MDETRDLYALLGVLPGAAPEIIRAVYLALAKKYHPDSSGSATSEDKLKEINAAYEILRDPARRREYDATRPQQDDGTGQYEPDVDDEDLFVDDHQSDWDFAIEYLPDLGGTLLRVAAISPTLSIVFQSQILTTKAFDDAEAIADQLISGFMHRYFGRDRDVIDFAENLLRSKKKAAAKELNRAANIFGDSINANTVIDKITKKFDLPQMRDKTSILSRDEEAMGQQYEARRRNRWGDWSQADK
jgi:curved DNA-binding protein CbpA